MYFYIYDNIICFLCYTYLCISCINYSIYSTFIYYYYASPDFPMFNLVKFREKKHSSENQAAISKHSSLYSLVIKRNTRISFSYSAAKSSSFSSAAGPVDTRIPRPVQKLEVSKTIAMQVTIIRLQEWKSTK